MNIKENSYFAGSVKSLGFNQKDQDVSVGVMLPGEYTFGTQAPERMTVVKGALVSSVLARAIGRLIKVVSFLKWKVILHLSFK